MEVSTTVDARGTRCPRPIIELAQAIDDGIADLVVLLADDPNARVDVPVWCRLNRHQLLEAVDDGGTWRFTVRIR
ncbi:MAG TPA: sulfurtransferase TusA family protein [Euzebyales bacterium]|nr:sulfurtransferase TusA family protein [Euzebyales bacterium]